MSKGFICIISTDYLPVLTILERGIRVGIGRSRIDRVLTVEDLMVNATLNMVRRQKTVAMYSRYTRNSICPGSKRLEDAVGVQGARLVKLVDYFDLYHGCLSVTECVLGQARYSPSIPALLPLR